MAGPRRLARDRRNNVLPNNPPVGTQTSSNVEAPGLPKHFPFPSTPIDSDIFFDFIMALFAIVGASLQFLHLYRSVWWLPQSFTNSTVNFYLIDPNVFVLIVLVFLRRLYFHVGCKVISRLYSNKSEEDLSNLSKGILSFFFAIITGILTMIVVGSQQKSCVIYLSYPVMVYLVIFGFQLRPLFETTSWCSNGIPPIHACTSNPADIRKECEILKANFNDRLKQICFTSVLNAYYGGFIPCSFSQGHIVFDKFWCFQHAAFMFCSSFVFSVTHMLPLRFCDILHRSALHLGAWEKVESGRNVVIVENEWKEDILWPNGVIVKYEKSVWRATGDCNSNRPGDRSLSRYYKMFITPSFILGIILSIQLLVVVFQLFVLMKITHWYKIFSLAIMLFFNYYPLYKITRDFLVSYKIYKPTEELDENKESKQQKNKRSNEYNLSDSKIMEDKDNDDNQSEDESESIDEHFESDEEDEQKERDR